MFLFKIIYYRAEITLGKVLKKKKWRRSSYIVSTKLFWGGKYVEFYKILFEFFFHLFLERKQKKDFQENMLLKV